METNDYIPRNARQIALDLLLLIPKGHEPFSEDLVTFIKSSFYKAPELLSSHNVWLELEIIMKRYIYNTDEEWKQNMIDVYIGKKI
jgi:hypothetical protein